ncbi:MAG: CRTAC1 family protein [Planctomycetes bacterium]|nr:CRTAC1 family protein [Planctomycetota bacterium]
MKTLSPVNVTRLVLAATLAAIGCGGRETADSRNLPATPAVEIKTQPPAFPAMKPQRAVASEVVVPGNLAFVDVAHERGLRFIWPEQPRPMTALDAFGAGCAVFDGNNDGWQDVLLVGNPHPSLFRNMGGGRFQEVTLESGLKAVQGHWTGCAIGDYDGDGLLDVVLTGYRQLALFKNVGDLRFELSTAAAKLDPLNQGYWGASVGFMDLDGDSWLDLVILNYVVYGPDSPKYCEYAPGVRSGCSPRTYLPERGQIWRNTGEGAFELVSSENGMQQTHGVGLVLAFTDLDEDGRMDFYIGNDGVAADLLHNQGQMRFENIASVAGVATSDNGGAVSAMGADWADFNRDGRLDLAVTNWHGNSFVMFQSLGHKLFLDSAKQTNLARDTKNRMGFGAKWVDFDNDGWPDLFFVNGHVYDNSSEIHGPSVPFRQTMCLFWNDRGRKLQDIVPQLGIDIQRSMVGRGSATGDFDNDGRVDLLAVDFEGAAMLLENRTETNHHWLKLDLRGKAPNGFAYGARVVGKTADQVWLAEVSPASSYLSSSDPRIHWGLGDHTTVSSISIRWPSGTEQTLHNVSADRILRVVEGEP